MICSKCHKPILPGEARHAAGEFQDPPAYCHYTCRKQALVQTLEDLEKMGPTGTKLAAMLKRIRII